MARVELHYALIFLLLRAVSSDTIAAPHAPQHSPRLFPRPMELSLGPMTDTLGVDPCSFGCVTAGIGWDTARLSPAQWPVQPETAFEIYRPLILRGANCSHVSDLEDADPVGQLRELSVMLNVSKDPSNASIEHYAINVQAGSAALIVSTYVGLVRGLETFSQLVTPASALDADLRIPASVRIRDGPAFEHRGILLDTARNFIPVDCLKQTVDAMAYSKLNVLHVRLHGRPLPVQLCTLASDVRSIDIAFSVSIFSDIVACEWLAAAPERQSEFSDAADHWPRSRDHCLRRLLCGTDILCCRRG